MASISCVAPAWSACTSPIQTNAMKQKYWLPFAFACVLCAGILIGDYIQQCKQAHSSPATGKLMRVINLISENYVDEVDLDSLIETTIPQILSNLDPHSSYISAEDYVRENSELQGQFSGVGVSFMILNDTINVIEVISGGPSEKMGILPGDRIISVDGKNMTGKNITNDDVFSALRGEKGTHVTIQVKRQNSKTPLTFEVTRDDIPVESVDAHYMIRPGIGYIKISRFARNTYLEFLQAMGSLLSEGAESIILDLRYNGGGYMDPSVLMANEFLGPNEVIVSTKGRNRANNQYITSDGSGSFSNCGLVVLVNEFTASSSEIFSGAIQDNDRGWIIGRRSFGKGLVQSPILLPDSSEVRLTVQRYYTPSGRSIQKSYTPGDLASYDAEIIERYSKGETFNADSVKLHLDEEYTTLAGRKVYGGGGIMPDVFVPEDTTGVTPYYVKVQNLNLISRFAYDYCDLNRSTLEKAANVEEMQKLLPSDAVLLQSFVQYAVQNGVPARWYYINDSAALIVKQIKGAIARNILGMSALYQILNEGDPVVERAIEHAGKPLPTNNQDDSKK